MTNSEIATPLLCCIQPTVQINIFTSNINCIMQPENVLAQTLKVKGEIPTATGATTMG